MVNNISLTNTEFVNTTKSIFSVYVPYISLPTRVSNTSVSAVDHIWSNILTDVKSGVFTTSITDHFTLFACLLNFRSDSDLVLRRFRDCSDTSIQKLRNRIKLDFDNFSVYDELSVDLRTKIFCNILWKAYEECCPIKTRRVSRRRLDRPWFGEELRRSCNAKHELFRRYRSGEILFDVYNNFKNKFTSDLRKAKQNYYRDKFNKCKTSVKTTWSNIRDLLGNVRGVNIDRIDTAGGIVDRQREFPDLFNNYFVSIAGDLRRNIPAGGNVSPESFLGVPSAGSIDVEFVTCDEVSSVISSLPNKGSRLNAIPTFIYKALSTSISPLISQLFNSTVIEGKFPDNLKVAQVIPIHKAGSTTLLGNYRPISTLTVLSKVFEKLMRSRLMEFFDASDLLSEHQFGFRPRHETTDAILEYLDFSYRSLDNKCYLLSIFLDFSKAFDTINHEILLMKLEHAGIRGSVLGWLSSYLENRKQFTVVNEYRSILRSVNTGVPQGSVLGPLLFLVYVNDMSKSSTLFNFVHFADDTTLYVSGENLMTLCEDVNRELVNIDKWLVANELSLNVNKTTYMVTSHSGIPDDLPLVIRDHVLAKVNVSKFLGVHIDDCLVFSCQVDYLCRKVSKSIGILYRLSSCMPPQVLVTLYFSIIHSHFVYGIAAWGGTAQRHLDKLNVLQRRAVKLLPQVGNVNRFSSYRILTINNLYKYFCGIKLYKSFVIGSHEYFKVKFNSLLPSHNYDTRQISNSHFNVPAFNKSTSQRSFFYNSTKLWNSLPSDVKVCPSVDSFKRRLKGYLLSIQNL